jgi:ABC-type branched-subunit amino acid transport system substrate-binding protein
MKQESRLFIPIIVVVICACSMASMHSTVTPEPDMAAALFDSAESLYEANSYMNALIAYRRYLDLYPYGSKADLALTRAAAIYAEQKNHDAERMAYQRLIEEHPASPYVADAMVKILITLYNEGNLRQVILQASEIIRKTDSKSHLFHTYAILGDTYLSLDSPRDAILFYYFAYQKASAPKEENILFKLNTVVSQLRTEDILSLLLRIDDAFLRSYLMYQLGAIRYEKQNYKEALKVFSEFIENFPDHERAQAAQSLIEEINARFVFKRRQIGCLLPLSGLYEKFGRRALRGIQFALDQFNSQSNQPDFELIVNDTGSEPQIAIRELSQLDAEGVALILGPIMTGEDAARAAQQKKIPIITLTQKPGISELGDYVFRNFLTPQMQIDTIVPYVVNTLGVERLAILYPEDRYGNTFMTLFKDKVIAYGATVVAVEPYKPDQTDFTAQIAKLSNWDQSANAMMDNRRRHGLRGQNRHVKSEVIVDYDAIFIPDVPEKIALIAPQLAFFDIDNVLLLGTNLWHSDKLIQMAGEYVQDAILADVFYAEGSNENVQEFIMRFEAVYGQRPDFIEALAYDAAMIAFQAASNPRVESRKDLMDELRNLYNFEGITGPTSFKENGDAVKKLYLLQVHDNKFVELNSP